MSWTAVEFGAVVVFLVADLAILFRLVAAPREQAPPPERSAEMSVWDPGDDA